MTAFDVTADTALGPGSALAGTVLADPAESVAGQSARQLASGFIILTVLTVVSIFPFCDKAFHVDDPLFLWTARQIRKNPFNFYGFPVNWYGFEQPMSQVNKNPPLTAYYLAVVTLLAGEGEVAVHTALLLPALGLVWGTYVLARRFCGRPLLASLATLWAPAALVGSTTVMCDVMMLALWCWAVVFWIWGLDRDRVWLLFTAGGLVAASTLTKYFGIALVPLLLLYAIGQKRRLSECLAALAAACLILFAYDVVTRGMYQRGLLSDAVSYATTEHPDVKSGLAVQGLKGLVYAGGGLASIACFAPLIWTWRGWLVAAVLAAAITFGLANCEQFAGYSLYSNGRLNWGFLLHVLAFLLAGIQVLALAGIEIYERRPATLWLFGPWLLGTLLFASYLNWSTNVRSVLPMVPAAAILLVRRLDARGPGLSPLKYGWPLVPALLLALAVAWGDYRMAGAAREAARAVAAGQVRAPRPLYFEGHWGFQYYLERAGARPVDFRNGILEPGDLLAMPDHNTTIVVLPEHYVALRETLMEPLPRWVSTIDAPSGANFYAALSGTPLPFRLGAGHPLEVLLFHIRKRTVFEGKVIEREAF